MQLLVGRLPPHQTQWLVYKCLLNVYQQANGKYKWMDCFLYSFLAYVLPWTWSFMKLSHGWCQKLLRAHWIELSCKIILKLQEHLYPAQKTSFSKFPLKVSDPTHKCRHFKFGLFSTKDKESQCVRSPRVLTQYFRIWSCTSSQRFKEWCFEYHDQSKIWQQKNRVLRTAGNSPTSWHLRAEKPRGLLDSGKCLHCMHTNVFLRIVPEASWLYSWGCTVG